jgi:hypothetical protein
MPAPVTLVALTSAKHVSFTSGLGLYDCTLDYDQLNWLRMDIATTFVDFLGRESQPQRCMIRRDRLEGQARRVQISLAFFTSNQWLSEQPAPVSSVQHDRYEFHRTSAILSSSSACSGERHHFLLAKVLRGKLSQAEGLVLLL